jgi:hypothetical protein
MQNDITDARPPCFMAESNARALRRMSPLAVVPALAGGVRGNRVRLGERGARPEYFRKARGGYDALRLALAEKVVLVEEPSDAIIFERPTATRAAARGCDRGQDQSPIAESQRDRPRR